VTRLAALACAALLLAACGKAEVVRRDYPAGKPRATTSTPRATPRVTPRPPAKPVAIPEEARVTVRAGETLYGISRRYGLTVAQVAAWNDLAAPYTLHVGQTLRLRAPATAVATTTTPTPGVPTTLPPEPTTTPTPFVTAKPPIVAPASPATPVATAPTPPATTPKPPVESAPSSAPPVVGAPTPPGTTPPPVTPPAVQPPATSTPSPVVATPATPPRPMPPITGGPKWQWPTRGSIVGRFVPGDQTRQGIDIAGQSGQRVDAAADGVEVYSGAGLVGYGELVIVKHNDEWLSAYAHNRRRLVAEGTKVRAGDAIAEMGRSGAIRDMLHFEIRRNGKPVDPLAFLPRR
jgi:lipoprotein NlpD